MASRRQKVEFQITARDRASRVLSSVGRRVRAFARQVLLLGGALAGIFGTALAQASERLRTLDIAARQTGIGIEELNRQANAFATTGVDVDDVADAYNEIAVKVGEALEGNDELLATLRELGATDVAIASRDTERILREIRATITPENARRFSAPLDRLLGGDLARRLLPSLRLSSEQWGELLQASTAEGAGEGLREAQEARRELERQFAQVGDELNKTLIRALPVILDATKAINRAIDFWSGPEGQRFIDGAARTVAPPGVANPSDILGMGGAAQDFQDSAFQRIIEEKARDANRRIQNN